MKQTITIVGLGFGDETSLNIGTWNLLQNAPVIWLRTVKHPVVDWMKNQGASFHSFDEVYEKHHQFEEVYEEIASQLIGLAKEHRQVVYAVPGHPMVAERTVQILLQEQTEAEIDVEIMGGGSFLDAAFARLQIDPIEGFQMVDGNDVKAHQLNPRMHILVGQVYDRFIASDVKLSLMEVYPADHNVIIGTALGIPSLEKVVEVPLYELDHADLFTDLSTVYVPPVRQESSLYRQFDYLVEVIETLRSPDGCPWDRKQTHESLRPYLIEEAYEAIEAIHNGDEDSLADELGDVLLQVLLHAQIGRDEGTFDIRDVIENLTEKMIRRHPHVFGETEVTDSDQVISNWQEIKKQERGEYGQEDESILSGIPKEYPTLLKSFEMQKKAAKIGFDWDSVEGVLLKVREELAEVVQAENQAEREEELGDLLFALGSLARWLQVDPELALIRANQKFLYRFSYLEEKANELGQSIQEISMEQLDAWWNEAKNV
ncbi:nucleoside triphosphate pyrophosphohydrolase [Thermoactinomyces sp. DSM 45892]|uniref:nucleoside triphosphate pyrophosphohydrolase n=1 Tax=Thermoactinomyces sp. DSM 45892 TaxID=1882753 RepID=UPI00089B6E30|nr:nucleoside triphosphate pyrophosphohydrolase [Thermoactinomyces sp. DSM 45892]SDY94932.1 tetrapyrrole methylase family protein / MazG family protein [Thermoactinomyces sp. DSM 45892]